MPDYHFKGYPSYIAAAAADLGLPTRAMDEARRQPAITRLGQLISQCTPATAIGILEQAEISLGALKIAHAAAEAMMAEAHEAFDVRPEPEPEQIVEPRHNRNRKA